MLLGVPKNNLRRLRFTQFGDIIFAKDDRFYYFHSLKRDSHIRTYQDPRTFLNL